MRLFMYKYKIDYKEIYLYCDNFVLPYFKVIMPKIIQLINSSMQIKKNEANKADKYLYYC